MTRPLVPYNPALVEKARQLRKQMTFSEVLLWKHLKNKQMMGYDFDRQKPMLNYITDFFCKDLMLAIEVDGITHADDAAYATKRQMDIEAYGVHFLRFDALEIVKDCDSIITIVANWMEHYEEQHGIPEHILKRRK